MFPYSGYAPTISTQFMGNSFVSVSISFKLLAPIHLIAFRQTRMFGAAVPKAAVNKECQPMVAEDKVGMAQHLLLSPPARYFTVPENRNQLQLRGLIALRPDLGHDLRALLFAEHVSHMTFCGKRCASRLRPSHVLLGDLRRSFPPRALAMRA
jgi:hypothetical protein